MIIIDHLITMDINISLLIAIIEINRYGAEIEELVEIVRSGYLRCRDEIAGI
jgi:hypothetical protein